MRATLLFSILLLAASCAPKVEKAAAQKVSRDPISVRGWIDDVDTPGDGAMFRTVETEAARRAQMFQAANVWVDNAPYVSGGIAENGAFVLLDVPSGDVSISFSVPGVQLATLTLENIPPNADVLIPGLVLRAAGSTVIDPKLIEVRLSGNVTKPVPTLMKASVVGVKVPVLQVPVNAMVDRRDYPTPPGSQIPLATVR